MENIIGTKYNRLKVVSIIGPNKHRRIVVKCICDCGKTKEAQLTELRTGHTKSCGCLHKEMAAERMRKYSHLSNGNRLRHGYTKKPEYYVWRSMKARCNNPNTASYKTYGGRGISICKRWLDSFDNFIADMGPRPTSKHVLDRIDFNGNYTPKNCRWATPEQDTRNRRSNRFLTYDGITMIEADWCKKLGLQKGAITKRLNSGWLPKFAFTVEAVKDIRERIVKSHKYKNSN